MHILYPPHKKMGHGQVYLTLDPDVEGGGIFEVSLSQLNVKEYPGELPIMILTRLLRLLLISALIKYGYYQECIRKST